MPVIGIGAGAGCDGQVLVIYDLLGMNPDFSPKFVKKYLDLGVLVRDAVTQFRDEVKHGAFPTEAHSFTSGSEPAKAAPVLQLYSSGGK
jgi:3-methyl-2-oxobutanoate hydroxymethyltransferase